MNALLVNALLTIPAVCALGAPAVLQDQGAENTRKRALAGEDEPYEIGSVVDEKITLRDLDGKEVTFKDLRGKVVFIHFWSMTCPYEVVADPKTVALDERYDDKDVVVLAINANSTEYGEEPPADAKPEERYKEIRAHLKKKEMDFRVFIDRGNVVADLFDARHTPHCFVLDKKGVLRYMGGLDDDPKGEKGDEANPYVRDAIDALLAGKEVAVKETKPYGCSIKRVKGKVKVKGNL